MEHDMDRELSKWRECTPSACPFCHGSKQNNLMFIAPNAKSTELDYWVIFHCIPCNRNFESNGKTVREYFGS